MRDGECPAKKTQRVVEEKGLAHFRQLVKYRAIKEVHEEYGFPIKSLCKILKVSKSNYYRWLKEPKSNNQIENEEICEKILEIHEDDSSCGYRRINDELYARHGIEINDKRALRLCRYLNIKSNIKYKLKGCTKNATKPSHIEENVLNREFEAERPNEKWLTDVTEFKYYIGPIKYKLYLSAILDLFDKRIVGFVISDRNDNKLVMETFRRSLCECNDISTLIHTDRGYQYTSHEFAEMVERFGMIHSMSRVGKCIDNGPMEGFWGILKREMYYNKKYTNAEELIKDIEEYIYYYNNKRVQRKLNRMSPIQYNISKTAV